MPGAACARRMDFSTALSQAASFTCLRALACHTPSTLSARFDSFTDVPSTSRVGDAGMTQPAKSQEPSMEEILASIRRIIADEDPADSAHGAGEHLEPHASRTAPARAAPPSPEPATRDEGFDSMLARLHASSRPAPEAPQEAREEQVMAAPARDDEEQPAIRRDPREQGLISPATAAAVDAALNTLAEAVQARNGRTLEEVVTELLRPMLKSWLDDNLPSIVERLVRAEIERVTRNR